MKPTRQPRELRSPRHRRNLPVPPVPADPVARVPRSGPLNRCTVAGPRNRCTVAGARNSGTVAGPRNRCAVARPLNRCAVAGPRNGRTVAGSLILAALIAVALVAAGRAGANPGPPFRGAFFHVQPFDPERCTSSVPITCGEVHQQTTATGTLEFDLYAFPGQWGAYPFSRITLRASFPLTWQVLDAATCLPADVRWDVAPGSLELEAIYDSLVWLEPWSEQPLLLRLVCHVPEAGTLLAEDLQLHCGTTLIWDFSFEARAGVEECYCFIACEEEPACHATFIPASLELSSAGEIVLDSLEFRPGSTLGWNGWKPCPWQLRSSVPWLELRTVAIDQSSLRLYVTVDPASMRPGEHEALIIGESACHACAHVTLHVEDTPPAVQTVRWGMLKRLWQQTPPAPH